MQNSTIEWTDHTFSPWHGCAKVSDGCKNCYALALDRRFGRAVWGPARTTPRMLMSESYWKQPRRWNNAAAQAGTRARVFCASMADVFEDHPQVVGARARLMCLIDETPHLDWLLLTKRPENILDMIDSDFPANVWIGTSVENQEQADKRIPHLLNVPARVRFLSCEPLLGAIDLYEYFYTPPHGFIGSDQQGGIHWVIAGGESGAGARPMHPDWARSLRDQCQAAGVAYFFKQWGEYLPRSQMVPGVHCAIDADLSDQPDDSFLRLGKHAAGRLLDMREWGELPL